MRILKWVFYLYFQKFHIRKYFIMPIEIIENYSWFDFFEKNNFSHEFIYDELNFSNLKYIEDKLPVDLIVKNDVIFTECKFHSKQHFLLNEIQFKFSLYSLVGKTHQLGINLQNEFILKNNFMLF